MELQKIFFPASHMTSSSSSSCSILCFPRVGGYDSRDDSPSFSIVGHHYGLTIAEPVQLLMLSFQDVLGRPLPLLPATFASISTL